MRAVIYARYSTENQREASIEDQVRLCRARLQAQGWTLMSTYTDAAVSGAIRMRPSYQKLLEDARAGLFDIVVAEALDRLSRDQEDTASLYKHLSFAGVKLFTLAEGEINELHVGLKGTMNALFLKDLRLKVRRGQEGRIRQGRSSGGLPYGYRVVRELDGRGNPVRGGRQIDDAQATIIRRIFTGFAAGRSPRAIARELNQAGTPGPGGRPWCDTMIRGHRLRGCGVLHNEIYIGKLVWNRQSFFKDPRTRKRVPRYNPRASWIIQDVPELRIVEQELWDKVHARLAAIAASAPVEKAKKTEFWKHRRARHFLTGLVFCAACGSPYAAAGRHYLACSAARRQGTCESRRGIPRQALEDLVLNALKHHLLAPGHVEEFIQEFHRQLNHHRRAAEAAYAAKERELDTLHGRIAHLIDAIADGLKAADLQQRLDDLVRRRSAVEHELADRPAAMPRLHPSLPKIYREKVARLHEALADPTDRDEALELLRGLVERVTVTPNPSDRSFSVDLVGEIANMVALLPGAEDAKREPFRSSVKVVAGERYQRYLRLFRARIPRAS